MNYQLNKLKKRAQMENNQVKQIICFMNLNYNPE